MRTYWTTSIAIAVYALLLATPARGLEFPYTEDFTAGPADWRDVGGVNDLVHVATGGPDGGSYVTTEFAFATATTASPPLFRAQDEYGSSGAAFEGDWRETGVEKITAEVRHNATEPLVFFARFSHPNNSPGVSIVTPAPIAASDDWTALEFEIDFNNPLLTVGAAPNQIMAAYNTAITNVGHLQIGVLVPSELVGNPTAFRFDLDKVSIVPEPASLMLVFGAVLCGLAWRRSSRS